MSRPGVLIAVAVLGLVALTGCGDRASEPARTSSSESSAPVRTSPTEFTQVAIVTQTAGGGQVAERATYLDDEDAVMDYVLAFPSEPLQRKLLAAIDPVVVPDGQRLAAAVVGLGCVVPRHLSVSGHGAELSITGRPLDGGPSIQCLAPITTVAVVLVPA